MPRRCPPGAQSDEYRDAVAEMMELTGALRNADVVMTQMVGYLKTSAPSVSEAVWEKIISKFNEKMRAAWSISMCRSIPNI